MFILVANILVTAGMYTPIAIIIYRRFRRRRFKHGTESSSEEKESNCSHDTSLASAVTTGLSTTKRNDTIASSTIGKSDSLEQSRRNAFKKEKVLKTNFNMMFFVIIFVYVVTYLPTAIMLTYATLDDTIWTKSSYDVITFYTFLIRSYVFNHAANPFIYVCFDIKLRANVRQLFCRNIRWYGYTCIFPVWWRWGTLRAYVGVYILLAFHKILVSNL